MKPRQTLETNAVVEDRATRLTADRCRLPDRKVIELCRVLHEADGVQVFRQHDDGESSRDAARRGPHALPRDGVRPTVGA